MITVSDRINGDELKKVIDTAYEQGYVVLKWENSIANGRTMGVFELTKDELLDIVTGDYGPTVVYNNCKEKGKEL